MATDPASDAEPPAVPVELVWGCPRPLPAGDYVSAAEAERLQAEVARLTEDARRHYTAAGTSVVLDTPAEAVTARVAAARQLDRLDAENRRLRVLLAAAREAIHTQTGCPWGVVSDFAAATLRAIGAEIGGDGWCDTQTQEVPRGDR